MFIGRLTKNDKFIFIYNCIDYDIFDDYLVQKIFILVIGDFAWRTARDMGKHWLGVSPQRR